MMKSSTAKITTTAALGWTAALLLSFHKSHAFTVLTATPSVVRTTTSLNGLFDGVKEAFGAPTLTSKIDSERETPIDRWMGWSVQSENNANTALPVPEDFVDAMDPQSYVSVTLSKPMGIVFEENDADYGGVFVQSLKPDSVAEQDGKLQIGDQLVAVEKTKVSGWAFDDALNAIVENASEKIALTVFRGTAKQLYGPTGASQEWLNEFIGVPAETVTADSNQAE